ncbi:site-specific integrase [Vagococcus carniphilus]|uniref:Site-specific integrase n=1 Tax=Vagococcus carniphilus TaxID=218144 RepID=A0A430AQ07_9ENTE|nr:site-specific integrase [Vagococcus carniphilus]QNN72560.1 site-specific integrase [Vagococcus carniphilus]RSU10199.1 site-specific integrase [Vagococcus carniphilus]
MLSNEDVLFHEYFSEWIDLYKVGAVRDVTLAKYRMSLQHLKNIAPNVKVSEMDRRKYQKILNLYALTHEKQTTTDFHHQLKGAIVDAVDERLIQVDPTRKVVIKGRAPSKKKIKFVSQFDLQKLINHLDLTDEINFDWLILLIAKTGLRFSEALALTPSDFNFAYQTISISKTWNYKTKSGGFQGTKNASSKRIVQLDWKTNMQFAQLLDDFPDEKLIFVRGRVFNSTVNNQLKRHCEKCGIPVISIHGLRHTHASLLLFAGVSIASVARRLGHANMSTTQQIYLHIIQELENQDNDKIMRYLSSI